MITQTVGQLLDSHVTSTLEGIDRIYLNAYQPMLQTGAGAAYFFRQQRGATVASPVLMAPMTKAFVNAIRVFASANAIEVVRFKKGERKDDITRERLRAFEQDEGVLYIGVAQEKFSTFRLFQRINPDTGHPYPWLDRSTVMCNQYYFYVVDADFGPLFIKFASYFPYTARICLNGHEYLNRQLSKQGIAFEALDNGLYHCDDWRKAQRLLDSLDEKKLDKVVRKWFAKLPHPFPAKDRKAGFRYELSVLQAEFALTQVFDQPLYGRYFFEEVIAENLVLSTPSI